MLQTAVVEKCFTRCENLDVGIAIGETRETIDDRPISLNIVFLNNAKFDTTGNSWPF